MIRSDLGFEIVDVFADVGATGDLSFLRFCFFFGLGVFALGFLASSNRLDSSGVRNMTDGPSLLDGSNGVSVISIERFPWKIE